MNSREFGAPGGCPSQFPGCRVAGFAANGVSEEPKVGGQDGGGAARAAQRGFS